MDTEIDLETHSTGASFDDDEEWQIVQEIEDDEWQNGGSFIDDACQYCSVDCGSLEFLRILRG